MAKLRVDGVVEAVHYNPDGQVGWVRALVRRGPTFSDRILLGRAPLSDHVKKGKHYYAGQRVHNMASTFNVTEPVKVNVKNGHVFVVTGDKNSEQDRLAPDPTAYYLVGYSLYELGKFGEADDYFRDAYLIDPEFSLEKVGLIKKASGEVVLKEPALTKKHEASGENKEAKPNPAR